MKSNELRESVASDYLELATSVYLDASAKCFADVSDLRDLMTIRARVEKEGLSFLTIELPRFARDFERSLANRKIDSTLFPRFKRVKGGQIPALLQMFVSQIFNRETGEIYDENCYLNRQLSGDIPTIIESVRQICLTFKKVELECTLPRVQATLASFITIEQSFESFSVPTAELAEFRQVSALLWDNMVSGFLVTDCIPKHGPGATAERVSGNGKYAWQRWHDRLEPYFPLLDNGYPLGTPVDAEELKNVAIIPEYEEQPVRVVSVPKTLKGPRTIAIEPCCMQYVQQGLRDYLYRNLETYSLTAGHLNFKDQGINQRLAVESSMTGQFATIDLSDASDRVPRSLALEMFRGSPDLQAAIDACRSTMAQMPDGTLVGPLRKFASMGSALCFPVEAMYFYTICVVALLKDRGLSYTLGNIRNVVRELYIYGDDIIVPVVNANAVLDHLRKYNCKVNTDKTFLSGSFRESCGIDAYAGYEVTPTYIRHPCPKNRQQASRIISWVASGNFFYKKGYWKTAFLMFSKLEKVIGDIPYLPEDSEGLGRISALGFETAGRWSHDLHMPQVKAYVPKPVYRTDKLEGYGALMKSFLGMSAISTHPWEKNRQKFWTLGGGFADVSAERSTLERSALHGAVILKRRWVPAR